jgi:hypothetical protein
MDIHMQQTPFCETGAQGFTPAHEIDMGLNWEDCDTLLTNAAAANGGPLREFENTDMSLIYQHAPPTLPSQQQLQGQQNSQQQEHFSSDSPSSFSSQATNMHNSPAFTSPPVTDVQVKLEPYQADDVSQSNYLFSNMQPPQQEVPNLSPPTTQSLSTTQPSGSKRRKAGTTRGNDFKSNESDEGRSNDLANNSNEDEDLTVKRKAQNRAAQRAFRERKEQRVRELEQKLGESEKEKLRLASENERLKKENTVISTENQVLMATTTSGGDRFGGVPPAPLKANFPVHKFSNLLLAEHDKQHTPIIANNTPSFVVYEKTAGDIMLGAGAVWEQIMQEPDSEDIDVETVMMFLRGKEHCDGFGPVFRLNDVKNGISLARRKY